MRVAQQQSELKQDRTHFDVAAKVRVTKRESWWRAGLADGGAQKNTVRAEMASVEEAALTGGARSRDELLAQLPAVELLGGLT